MKHKAVAIFSVSVERLTHQRQKVTILIGQLENDAVLYYLAEVKNA